MNILIVCQARTGSTRLPGKVLLPLAGKPLIVRCMERIQRSHLATTSVVATTTDPVDDQLVATCLEAGLHVFQGHPTDLLDRHYRAGVAYNADIIVKVPSDCPLIDPMIIDLVIQRFLDLSGTVDYVSNLHPASFPDGNDVEVFSMLALEQAWHHARRDIDREHTTPWFWDNNSSIRTANYLWQDGRDLSTVARWTVDYPEDYMFVRAVYEHLYPTCPTFGLIEILELVHEHPEIEALNSHLAGTNWYSRYLQESVVASTVESSHRSETTNGFTAV